jgi:hypothetical protein
MLADQGLDGEDAGAAVRAGTGRLAHLGEGRGSGLDGLNDCCVVDDEAVADDHWDLLGGEVRQTRTR